MAMQNIDPKKFQVFIEINNLINSNYSDLNVLLSVIVQSAMQLTGSEAASLLLLEPETNTLHFEIALGSKGHEVKNFVLKMGEGIAGWVAEKNTSLIVNEVDGDKRFFADISKIIGFKTNSILAVPLRARDKCVGVLEMINKKSLEVFNEEDLFWLETFSNQAGIAFVNAKQILDLSDEIVNLRRESQVIETKTPIVYKSETYSQVINMARKVALTSGCVMLSGESGVGKEVIAEEIHFNSHRKSKSFVKVNCASIPESLMESEFFGHVKGAFTDAYQDKMGKFALADKGTLFLDEIGELPLNLQAKLLRVLQNQTIEPVGSNQPKTIDVRVITATNQNLEKMVQEGKFRRDLYYRLNVLPLFIPPLRERKEDIMILANYFLLNNCHKMKKHVMSFSAESIHSLSSYQWPGNVRELKNTIERSVVLAEGSEILPSDLHLSLPGASKAPSSQMDLKNALNHFKSQYIANVLANNNGNQTKTAEALDIQRTYLSKLIKELNIETNTRSIS